MGGFKPSRADIAGSTIVGSAATDVHEFTGSVSIAGSLTLNGAGVAPGGAPGGATTQIQYNDSGAFAGSANLTFDGSNLTTTGSLYLSSSAVGSNVPLLRIDHAGSGDDNPILFVTGSGFVGIGVLEPTYHLQVAASNLGDTVGTTRALRVESDTGGEWFSVNGGSISFGAVGGFAKWGGIDLGQRFNIAPFNATYGALGIGKYPGSTVNIVEVNSANSDQGGDFFVIDSDGKVGIGVTDPDSELEVLSTTTQQKWSYDANSFATITVEDGGDTTIAASETGNITIDGDDINLVADGGQINFKDPTATTRFAIDIGQSTTYLSSPQDADMVFRVGAGGGMSEVFRIDQSADSVLMSGSLGATPIQFRDTATSIHSPDFNRLALTAPTLEVTGTLGLNGTSLTSTAAELNLLDASATTPAVNAFAAVPRIAKATYDFSVLGGSLTGPTKTLPSVTLPDNAIIVGGWIDTEDNLDGGGGATVSFGVTLGSSTTLFLGATAFGEFASEAGGPMIPISQATSPATYLKLGAATTLTMTIATAALTSGIVHLYVQYVMGS